VKGVIERTGARAEATGKRNAGIAGGEYFLRSGQVLCVQLEALETQDLALKGVLAAIGRARGI
jgi:hypothetical protein